MRRCHHLVDGSVGGIAGAGGSAGASTAPSAEASQAANLADDQTLNVTLGNEDPATLDPTLASTSTSIGVLHALNRGLIYFDKDQNTVPSLAEALPEISADGLTYTFKLRDAKYSNGDPIVAGDLVYAWKRLIDPRTAAKYQAFLADVAGGQALVDITGVTPAKSDAEIDALLAKFGVAAPDDKTFVVTLDHPTGYFLDIVALWGAAPIQEKWVKTPQFTEAANLEQRDPTVGEGCHPDRPGLVRHGRPVLRDDLHREALDPLRGPARESAHAGSRVNAP